MVHAKVPLVWTIVFAYTLYMPEVISHPLDAKGNCSYLATVAMAQINSIKDQRSAHVSDADIAKLIKVVQNPATSAAMLQYVTDSVVNVVEKNGKLDSVILEDYFFNQLNTVGNISRTTFYDYVLQIENLRNPALILDFIKAKREDDPDDMICLFFDWGLMIHADVKLANPFDDLEVLDTTFTRAKERMQVRKRIEANPLYNDKFINNENFEAMSRDQLRRHVQTLLGIVVDELETMGNNSCYLSTISKMQSTLDDEDVSKAMVYLIGQVTANMFYLESTEFFKEFLIEYMERKVAALGDQSLNEIRRDMIQAPFLSEYVMHISSEGMAILILKWQSLLLTEVTAAQNQDSVNIWQRFEDNFNDIDVFSTSLYNDFLSNSQIDLINEINETLPIVAIAMNMGNADGANFLLLQSAYDLIHSRNASMDALEFIKTYLEFTLNPNANHENEIIRLAKEYQIRKLNRISYLSRDRLQEILSMSDEESKSQVYKIYKTNPSTAEAVAFFWKQVILEMTKGKLLTDFFQVLEKSFEISLKLSLKLSNKLIIDQMLCHVA